MYFNQIFLNKAHSNMAYLEFETNYKHQHVSFLGLGLNYMECFCRGRTRFWLRGFRFPFNYFFTKKVVR